MESSESDKDAQKMNKFRFFFFFLISHNSTIFKFDKNLSDEFNILYIDLFICRLHHLQHLSRVSSFICSRFYSIVSIE